MERFALALLLAFCSLACFAGPFSGTWVMRGDASNMTMTVVEVGAGWKVIYKASGAYGPGGKLVNYESMFETQADGKDAPHIIDGKPTGQTISVKKIDDRHTVSTLKFEGKETGISKAEVSADGKTLTVQADNPVDSPNGPKGKSTQVWDRK